MAESKPNIQKRWEQLRQEVIRQQELDELERLQKSRSDAADTCRKWHEEIPSKIAGVRHSTLATAAAVPKPRDAAYCNKVDFETEKEHVLSLSSESSDDDIRIENASTATEWYRTCKTDKRSDVPANLVQERAHREDLERRLSHLESKHEELQARLCRYKSEHAESERRREQLENKVEKLETREERYKFEIAKLKFERDQANARIAELEFSNKAKEEEKENLMALAREQETKEDRMNRVQVVGIEGRKRNRETNFVRKNTQGKLQLRKAATKVSVQLFTSAFSFPNRFRTYNSSHERE